MIDYANPRKVRVPGGAGQQAALWFASHVAWIFIAIFLTGGLILAVVGVMRSPVATVYTVVLVLLVLVIAAASARAARQSRAMQVLTYIEQAVRVNLPVPEMLRAAARVERAALARRLRAVAEEIEQGAPIAEAISLAVPEMPRRAVSLVTSAERSGTLAPTLARIVREQRPASSGEVFRGSFARVYVVVMVLLLGGLFAMQTIFVVPKFEQILRDFGVPPPWSMLMMISVSRIVAPIAAGVAAIVLLLMLARAWRELLRPQAMGGDLLCPLRDRLVWWMPFFGTMQRDRGLADAFRSLADALEAGRPLEWALPEVHQPHANQALQARLRDFAMRVIDGEPMGSAAREARLPRLASSMLATARHTADTPQVLDFLARYYERRFSRAALLLRAAAIPAVALIGGGLVLFAALSMWQPLIRISDAVVVYPVQL